MTSLVCRAVLWMVLLTRLAGGDPQIGETSRHAVNAQSTNDKIHISTPMETTFTKTKSKEDPITNLVGIAEKEISKTKSTVQKVEGRIGSNLLKDESSTKSVPNTEETIITSESFAKQVGFSSHDQSFNNLDKEKTAIIRDRTSVNSDNNNLSDIVTTESTSVSADNRYSMKETSIGSEAGSLPAFNNGDINTAGKSITPAPDNEQLGNADMISGTSSGRVLVVSLGGGEDELFAASAAALLTASGHEVGALVYGPSRETTFPSHVKIIEIPVTKHDPLLGVGVSGGAAVGSREWAPGGVVWSRVAACAGLASIQSQIIAFEPALIVTPLWLHDVCTLPLATRLNVPAIGVLTSRVGAWWAWTQLGALPDLASASAPTGGVGDPGLYARLSNLAQHYAFVSTMRQRWQAPAVSSLPYDWQQMSLPDMYRGLHRLLVVWDPLLHPSPPHTPSAVSIGGFAANLTPITKDVLVPALLNRAGLLVVSCGGREVWVGSDATNALYRVLAPLPYTVLWHTPFEHLKPNASVDMDALKARFLFKENIPLNALLGHPRHRVLVSCCGESDVMACAHFASPVLCVPVTTDQMLAAQHLKQLGVAEVVPAWEASVEALRQALQLLTKHRSYRLKARALAEDLHDQPMSPAETFLYHVQHTIRRPRSRRYHILGSELSMLQQGNADVFLLLSLLLALLIIAVMTTLMTLGPALLKKSKRKAD